MGSAYEKGAMESPEERIQKLKEEVTRRWMSEKTGCRSTQVFNKSVSSCGTQVLETDALGVDVLAGSSIPEAGSDWWSWAERGLACNAFARVAAAEDNGW